MDARQTPASVFGVLMDDSILLACRLDICFMDNPL